MYILVPQEKTHTCEVVVLYTPEYEWCLIDDPGKSLTFDSKIVNETNLPRLSADANARLYEVWDDGAEMHPHSASYLYEEFKKSIDQYSALAKKTKENLFRHNYENEVRIAKEKGWSVALVTQQTAIQPYDSF